MRIHSMTGKLEDLKRKYKDSNDYKNSLKAMIENEKTNLVKYL